MTAKPGPSPEIRVFRPGDTDAVQALIFRTIDACYAGIYPAAAVAYFKKYHSRGNIEQDAESGLMLVLEADGHIVGCGCLAGNTIKRVFVDPGFQRHGCGRLMMARLEQRARDSDLKQVFLDASLPSKRLYDLLGYRAGELAHIPVGDGQYLDYYPMTKTLE